MRSETTPVDVVSFSNMLVLVGLGGLKLNAGMLRFNDALGLGRVLEPPQLTWGPIKQ